MKKFELNITLKDWIYIITISVLFSSLITTMIYLSIDAEPYQGIIAGTLLGFCLGILSFGLIGINNKFILPLIKKPSIWWISSAIFAFISGFSGFYLAYYLSKILSIEIPEPLRDKLDIFAIFVGSLNYFIGLLLYLFINMKTKKIELENLIIESRLLALNTQLNSHFLFNILNSIIELINIDSKKAEKALIILSKFLRKVLKEDDLIFISDEIENVKTYVELENLRYGNMINLKISDSIMEIWDFKIPKFSIQLIIENAVKHGFMGKELNIEIATENLPDKIKIYIKNNGKVAEELKFGIGLNNLAKRISLLCKGYIQYKEAEKTEFIINIPK